MRRCLKQSTEEKNIEFICLLVYLKFISIEIVNFKTFIIFIFIFYLISLVWAFVKSLNNAISMSSAISNGLLISYNTEATTKQECHVFVFEMTAEDMLQSSILDGRRIDLRTAVVF